jgi:hypothetical protein
VGRILGLSLYNKQAPKKETLIFLFNDVVASSLAWREFRDRTPFSQSWDEQGIYSS